MSCSLSKALISAAAGASSGSVLTWMIMDNEARNAGRRLAEQQAAIPAPVTSTASQTKLFFGLAAAGCAAAHIIRRLAERR